VAEKKTVLVVEDHEDTREWVAEVLREAGYDVREAKDGAHALHMLENSALEPNLILLDMMMPVMSGRELLEALSGTQLLAALPVVVVTASGATEAPHAREVLRKPISPSALLNLVREYCGDAVEARGPSEAAADANG
jgi:CheY-like chemotaxis protein